MTDSTTAAAALFTLLKLSSGLWGSGLINGMADGALKPGGQAARAQVAAILHRFCTSVR